MVFNRLDWFVLGKIIKTLSENQLLESTNFNLQICLMTFFDIKI